MKLTVECREAGYRAVTGVKASSVAKGMAGQSTE